MVAIKRTGFFLVMLAFFSLVVSFSEGAARIELWLYAIIIGLVGIGVVSVAGHTISRKQYIAIKTSLVLLASIVLIWLLSGCAVPRSYTAQAPVIAAPKYFVPQPQADWVPMDFENPSLLGHEVILFEGSGGVELVPDRATGKWMFNRVPFAHFPIGRANSERNWHEYERVYLPRNTEFVAASRTVNLWGAGWPEYYYIRTGSNPGWVQYTRVTPSFPQVYAAGVVTLRERAIAPFGNGPLILEYTLDTRPVGAAIKRGISDAAMKRAFDRGRFENK